MHHASAELRRKAQPFLSGEKETYATVLLGILLQVYGAECLDWDPIVVESQIKDDFDVSMPDVVFNQLMALMNVMTTDTVYTSVETFDHTISYLCRTESHDQDAPSPHELAWCCFEMMVNDPDPYNQGKDPQPFSPDIAAYCGVVLADAGVRKKPLTLKFAIMPRWAPTDVAQDATMSNASQVSETDLAQEIDRFVESQASVMVQHLAEIGVRPAPLLQAQKDDLPKSDPLADLFPA